MVLGGKCRGSEEGRGRSLRDTSDVVANVVVAFVSHFICIKLITARHAMLTMPQRTLIQNGGTLSPVSWYSFIMLIDNKGFAS